MTVATRSDPRAGRLRRRELASLGAERAAKVLGEFAGTPVHAGPLRTGEALKTAPFETGVIFRFEGPLGGTLAFCLDLHSRRVLVRLLLDEDEPEAPPDMVASALSELANIVASQAVSAIADALGAGISLSVPELALEGAAARLQEMRAAHEPHAREQAFFSELSAPGSELRVLLVIAPD